MSYPIWGHCLTDNIRRIWFLKSEFMKQFKNCPIVYIAFDGQNLENQQNFRRLLEILELDVNGIQEIKQPTHFKRIILPDESFIAFNHGPVGFTNEYCEMINRVRDFALKNQTPTSCKKIYYFYGCGRKYEIGEERLAEYFRSKGYEIIRPETLTLDEQLNLLINCESFASTLGSSVHNSIFLREETQTIAIPRAYYNFEGYQEKLNQINSMNINYIDSSLSIFSKTTISGPFFYIISEQLKKFFGDEWNGYDEEDFKTFLQYVKYSMKKGCVANQNTMKYYAPILEDFMAQLKQHENLIVSYNMPKNWETFQPPPKGYQTHVASKGWSSWLNEDQISNDIEQQLDIQAVKINFPGHKVYYAVYFNDAEGWSEEVTNGQQAGTTGKSKAIYGIKIRLDESGAKKFDILYRVHKFDGTWTDWAKNGEVIYSHGQKLNALQIKLEKH